MVLKADVRLPSRKQLRVKHFTKLTLDGIFFVLPALLVDLGCAEDKPQFFRTLQNSNYL
jgi:hypothetical protein